MRKLLLSMIFVITLLISSPSLANAVPMTVDFSSGAYGDQTNCVDCKYSEKGIDFTTPDAPGQHFDSDLADGVLIFHEGGNNPADQIVLTAFGGQIFNIISFDLVNVQFNCDSFSQPAMVITGSNGQVVNLPQGNTGTVNLNFNFVTSVTIDPKPDNPASQAASVCMDNYVFDDKPPVGGELLPIDTTALLLSGVQTNLGWIVPLALSVIGIGIFGTVLVRRK